MSLLKLQKFFSTHIFDAKSKEIIASLPYERRQEALVRLNVYRNNIFGNFTSVLSAIFVAVKNVVGEKEFVWLVKKYQEKYPAKSGNLDCYGENFPQFLKKHKPAFLLDLAQLELNYHNCYFVEEVDEFDVENFKKLSPEKLAKLKFKLDLSCILLQSKFPIYSIWKNEGKKISTSKKSEYTVTQRLDGICKIHQLTEEEFLFLENLRNGKNLFQTYKKISAIKKDFDVGSLLNKFIHERIIVSYK